MWSQVGLILICYLLIQFLIIQIKHNHEIIGILLSVLVVALTIFGLIRFDIRKFKHIKQNYSIEIRIPYVDVMTIFIIQALTSYLFAYYIVLRLGIVVILEDLQLIAQG